MADNASVGANVGGVTFKITVDTSAVNLNSISSLYAKFSALELVFTKMANSAKIVSKALSQLANIEKRVQGTTQSLTSATKKLMIARRALLKAQQQYNQALQAGNQATATAAKQSQSFAKNLNAVAAATGLVSSALGGLKLAEFIKDATIYAGRVENLGTILEQVGTNASYTRTELRLYEEQVRALGITTESARYSMTLLARNHLDLAKAAKIARIAQDSAVIAGIDSSKANERIAISVQRLDTRMLRNLGILVNLRNEYQRFALATGRVETSLTAFERQQILMEAVLRAGINTVGTYEAAMQDAYKQYTSRVRLQKEALKEFGEQLQWLFSGLVTLWSDLLRAFTSLDEETKSVIVGLTTFVAVTLTATAAVGALALVVIGLGSAALPILGVAAAIGAVTGAVAYSVSSFHAMQRTLQETQDEYLATTERAIQLREEYENVAALEKYAETTELTARQSAALADSYERLLTLAPELRSELEKLSSAEERLAFLRERVPEVTTTTQERITEELDHHKDAVVRATTAFQSLATASPFHDFVGDVRSLQTAVDELSRSGVNAQEAYARLREEFLQLDQQRMSAAGSAPAVYPMSDRVGETVFQQIYNDAVTHFKAMEQERESFAARELRWLEDRVRAHETANQLALRMMNRLEESRVKMADSAGFRILDDARNYTSALQDSQLVEAQILKKSALDWERRRRNIMESANIKKADAGMVRGLDGQLHKPSNLSDDELDKLNDKLNEIDADMQKSLSDAQKALEADTQKLLLERQNILKAQQAAREIIDNEVAQREAEVRLLAAENRMISSDTDSGLLKTMDELDSLLRGAAVAERELTEAIAGGGDKQMQSTLEAQQTSLEIQRKLLIDRKKEAQEAGDDISGIDSQLSAIGVAAARLDHDLSMIRGGYREAVADAVKHREFAVTQLRDAVADEAMQKLILDSVEGTEKLNAADMERVQTLLANSNKAMAAYNMLIDAVGQHKGAIQNLDQAEQSLSIERDHRQHRFQEQLLQARKWLTDQQRQIRDTEEELAEDRETWHRERLELLGAEIRELKTVRSELDRVSEEIRKGSKDVDSFLEKQRVLAIDRKSPGFKDVFETQEDFLDQIKSATTKDQLDDLQKALGSSLRDQIEDTQKDLVELGGEYRDIITEMMKVRAKAMLDPKQSKDRLIALEQKRRELAVEILKLQEKLRNQQTWSAEAEKNAAEHAREQLRILQERAKAYNDARKKAEEEGRLEEFNARQRRAIWEESLHPMELEVRLLEEQEKLRAEELTKHDQKLVKLNEEAGMLSQQRSLVQEQAAAWQGVEIAVQNVSTALAELELLQASGEDTSMAEKVYARAATKAQTEIESAMSSSVGGGTKPKPLRAIEGQPKVVNVIPKKVSAPAASGIVPIRQQPKDPVQAFQESLRSKAMSRPVQWEKVPAPKGMNSTDKLAKPWARRRTAAAKMLQGSTGARQHMLEQRATNYSKRKELLAQQYAAHKRRAAQAFALRGRVVMPPAATTTGGPVPTAGTAAPLASAATGAAAGVEHLGASASKGIKVTASALDSMKTTAEEHADQIDSTTKHISKVHSDAASIRQKYRQRGR